MTFRIDEGTLQEVYELGQRIVEVGVQINTGLLAVAIAIGVLAFSHLLHGILTRTRRPQ